MTKSQVAKVRKMAVEADRLYVEIAEAEAIARQRLAVATRAQMGRRQEDLRIAEENLRNARQALRSLVALADSFEAELTFQNQR